MVIVICHHLDSYCSFSCLLVSLVVTILTSLTSLTSLTGLTSFTSLTSLALPHTLIECDSWLSNNPG